jgi:glycosyltransferase involved in cell wall biosynthesis
MALSVAIIVRDGEDSIGAVLDDAARFADEIVTVDTGSRDSTLSILKAHRVTIDHFHWVDDFAAARNYSFSRCHGDWIMWLDADDRVPLATQEGIIDLKADLARRGNQASVVYMPYRMGCLSESFDAGFAQVIIRERIVRASARFEWIGRVHETIAVGERSDTLYRPDIWIEHRPPKSRIELEHSTRNLHLIEQEIASTECSALMYFYYGRVLFGLNRVAKARTMLARYLKRDSMLTDPHYEALLLLARCEIELNRPARAVARLLEAIGLDSRRAEAYVQLAEIYCRRRQYKRALPLLVAAASTTPGATPVLNAGAYSWIAHEGIGDCLAAMARFEEAIVWYTRALETTPEKSRILGKLAQTSSSSRPRLLESLAPLGGLGRDVTSVGAIEKEVATARDIG